jgi:ubiquinone/menaquinone biosynthesis C-methylase UbiE
MIEDPYKGFADRYDWMTGKNPAREQFFHELFAKYKIANVLDCACGTGKDLIMFHGMGKHGSRADLTLLLFP